MIKAPGAIYSLHCCQGDEKIRVSIDAFQDVVFSAGRVLHSCRVLAHDDCLVYACINKPPDKIFDWSIFRVPMPDLSLRHFVEILRLQNVEMGVDNH